MTDLTNYTSSDGRVTPLVDMPYSHLKNAINKRARDGGGGPDPLLDAMRAELARRPAPDPAAPMPAQAARPVGESRALPRAGGIGDNNPPTDANPLKERLEENHADLLSKAANLELQAGKLPKNPQTDDDVAEINGWILAAQGVTRTAEKERKEAKEPFLTAGKTVDEFFGGIGNGISSRIKSMEARKVPYLQAKRTREEAERAAQAEALRKSQAEARQREEDERAEVERHRQAAREAEQKLREARTPEEIEAAEVAYRAAARLAQLSEDAAEQAVKDARKVEKAAVREEKILSGDHRHKLGRVDAGGAASSLTSSWKPEVHNRQRFMASLGPLGPFLGDQAIDSALLRAAKADPRPAIPGVDFVEEFTSQTRATSRI